MVVICKDYLNIAGMYETIAEHFGKQGVRIISAEKEFSEYVVNVCEIDEESKQVKTSNVKFNIIETKSLLHVILNGPQEETAEVMADLDDVIKQFNLAKTA